ncbi:MAG TPA: hypothetical protein DIC28_07615 [Aerococcus urinaeequi]|nr:hypothetical protein FPV23_01530 [Carnobacterium sp. PL17RED31]HCT98353.1 hypothetical protein [Aerococcus urinaeequi]
MFFIVFHSQSFQTDLDEIAYNGDDFSFFLKSIITKFRTGVDKKAMKAIIRRDRITFKYDIINGRKKLFGFIYVMKTVFI